MRCRCWSRPPPAAMPVTVDEMAEAVAGSRTDRRNCSTWPCPIRLHGCDGRAMAVYVWQQDMEPDFPLAVLEYTARGDGDPMHWHDHFEIALVHEGRGTLHVRAASARRGGRRHLLHRQLAAACRARRPRDDAAPAARPVPPGAPRRPGCRELDLGYLAPFRVDERTGRRGSAGRRPWPRRSPPSCTSCARPGPATIRPSATSRRHAAAGPRAGQPRHGRGRHGRGHPCRRGPPGADPPGPRLRGRPLPREHHPRRRRGARPRQPVPRPARVQGRDRGELQGVRHPGPRRRGQAAPAQHGPLGRGDRPAPSATRTCTSSTRSSTGRARCRPGSTAATTRLPAEQRSRVPAPAMPRQEVPG